jgi:hypothetical protein
MKNRFLYEKALVKHKSYDAKEILVTLLGMVTAVRPLQPQKAHPPILVTPSSKFRVWMLCR